MAASGALAVTGVTGAIGGRVADRLAARGVPIRMIARDPSKAPELPGAEVRRAAYQDGEAMRSALDGVDTLLLVSGREDADRLDHHRSAVEAAAEAAVGRIVYLSFLAAAPDATFTFARDHFHTEAMIRATGRPFAFLRSSLYIDFMPWMCGDDGVIRGPAGSGRFWPVTRDDIADVCVGVTLDEAHDGATYDMTGPDRLTMTEVAAELQRATGRPISFEHETLEEARASRAHFGAPDWEVEGWVTSYAAIATGEMDVQSDAVRHVTGHPPQSLRDYLAAHPDTYDRLRAG